MILSLFFFLFLLPLEACVRSSVRLPGPGKTGCLMCLSLLLFFFFSANLVCSLVSACLDRS